MKINEKPVRVATEIAIDEVNRTGGVLGAPVTPKYLDTRSDPECAELQVRQAVDSGIHVYFGGWLSSVRMRIQPSLRSAPSLLFYPQQYEGFESDPSTIYLGSTLHQQKHSILNYCKAQGIRKIALVGTRYIFPYVFHQAVIAAAEDDGFEVHQCELVNAENQNFRSMIDDLDRVRPELILSTINGITIKAFHRRLDRSAHSEVPVIHSSVSQNQISLLGLKSQSIYLCDHYFYNCSTRDEVALQAALSARLGYDVSPSSSMVNAYNSVHMWAGACNAIGNTDPNQVREYLLSSEYNGVGESIQLRKNAHSSWTMSIVLAHDAGSTPVWRSKERIEPEPYLGLDPEMRGRELLGNRTLTSLMHASQAFLDSFNALDRQKAELEKEREAKQRAQKRIEFLRQHDDLTGLFNYEGLLKQVEACSAKDGESLVFVYLDFDNFGQINANYGRYSGDLVLREIGSRLRSDLSEEGALIARIRGDEFVVIMTGRFDRNGWMDRINDLKSRLMVPIPITDGIVSLSVSIGVHVCDQNCDSCDFKTESMLRLAHESMLANKYEHGSAITFSEREMVHLRSATQLIRMQVQEWLNTEALSLFYQPKVRLKDGHIAGFEALVRGPQRDHGVLVSPGEFLPYLSGSDLQQEVDWWVIERAIADLASVSRHDDSICFSINVNPKTLLDPPFVTRVLAFVEAYDLRPDQIEFEILETELINDTRAANAVIVEGRKLGLHFSIDDCGSGYSSLQYIKDLSVGSIKIDQSFVRELPESKGSMTIVRNFTIIGHELDLCVTAEGIETIEIGAQAVKLGCDAGQGYAIAAPMPLAQVLPWKKSFQHPEVWSKSFTSLALITHDGPANWPSEKGRPN